MVHHFTLLFTVVSVTQTFGVIKGDESIGFAQAVSQGGNNVSGVTPVCGLSPRTTLLLYMTWTYLALCQGTSVCCLYVSWLVGLADMHAGWLAGWLAGGRARWLEGLVILCMLLIYHVYCTFRKHAAIRVFTALIGSFANVFSLHYLLNLFFYCINHLFVLIYQLEVSCCTNHVYLAVSPMCISLTPLYCLQVEELVMPYLSAFAKFRDDVRQVARQQKGMTLVMLLSN